ncbi:MAG TPA: imidazole glycerol phosphate synthase subunit HisH [Parvularcula sp.]|nr:imidazole glycerol phosphate synthase subunit HisH [Parvularcula sp.]HBS33385.1 imidazole glycerol phosphate synthase subunit HisH [Parvularcula sp.]
MTVGVIKIGVGNTASVLFALERLGAKAVLTDDPRIVAECERIILPGVGSALFAMTALAEKGLSRAILEFARPVMGVCLGQQMFFDSSEEGDATGLGLFDGRVTRLKASRATPAPHVGWSRLTKTKESALLEGVADGAYVYFVHSYVCPVTEATAATAAYGETFCAAIENAKVWGCQFHPERSGKAGARILANFLAAPC